MYILRTKHLPLSNWNVFKKFLSTETYKKSVSSGVTMSVLYEESSDVGIARITIMIFRNDVYYLYCLFSMISRRTCCV